MEVLSSAFELIASDDKWSWNELLLCNKLMAFVVALQGVLSLLPVAADGKFLASCAAKQPGQDGEGAIHQ